MDKLEELIENSDKIVVNYIQPKYTPKEQLVLTAIGVGVGLTGLAFVWGVHAVASGIGTWIWNRSEKKRKLDQQFEAFKNPSKV